MMATLTVTIFLEKENQSVVKYYFKTQQHHKLSKICLVILSMMWVNKSNSVCIIILILSLHISGNETKVRSEVTRNVT